MSDRLFERAINDWLESGSDRTPPNAIDAVLLAVRTTPQARRGLLAPRRFNSMTRTLALVAAIVVIAIGAFAVLGGGRPPTTSPSPVPSVLPSSGGLGAVPGGRLAYDRYTGGSEKYVGTFIAASNGTGEHELVVTAVHTDGLMPIWSPDGRQLLILVCDQAAGCQPGIVGADGTGFRYLNQQALQKLECTAWSPDGKTLLCDTDGLSHDHDGIYRIGVDGTGLAELTVSPFFETVGTQGDCGGGDNRAVFSPDGKQFAFIRQRCGPDADPSYGETGALMVANLDGSGVHEVLPQGSVNTHFGARLAWSPDGAWIAFGTTTVGNTGELEAVKPDGTGLHKLIASDRYGTSVVGPAWSPDGKAIVISTWDAGKLDVVGSDGSSLGELSALTPGNFNVDWGVAAAP
jgi:Tol biopolymer transport system component